MASTARRLPCFGFAVAQRKQDCAVFVNPDRPALSTSGVEHSDSAACRGGIQTRPYKGTLHGGSPLPTICDLAIAVKFIRIYKYYYTSVFAKRIGKIQSFQQPVC